MKKKITVYAKYIKTKYRDETNGFKIIKVRLTDPSKDILDAFDNCLTISAKGMLQFSFLYRYKNNNRWTRHREIHSNKRIDTRLPKASSVLKNRFDGSNRQGSSTNERNYRIKSRHNP